MQNNFEEPSNKLAQDNINSSRKTLFQSIQEFFSNNIESKDQNVIESQINESKFEIKDNSGYE